MMTSRMAITHADQVHFPAASSDQYQGLSGDIRVNRMARKEHVVGDVEGGWGESWRFFPRSHCIYFVGLAELVGSNVLTSVPEVLRSNLDLDNDHFRLPHWAMTVGFPSITNQLVSGPCSKFLSLAIFCIFLRLSRSVK
jgi:hypothetical protein